MIVVSTPGGLLDTPTSSASGPGQKAEDPLDDEGPDQEDEHRLEGQVGEGPPEGTRPRPGPVLGPILPLIGLLGLHLG